MQRYVSAERHRCIRLDALVSHLPKTLCETRQCLEVFFYQKAKQERLLEECLHELNLEYF
jgi:hypothetical protein